MNKLHNKSRSDSNIFDEDGQDQLECHTDIPGLLTRSQVQPQLILQVYFIFER